LTPGRVGARVTKIHRKIGEKNQSTLQRPQPGIMRQQGIEKQFQVVNIPDRKSQLFHQSLEIFFGTLLAVKENAIMNGNFA
jgi:hypothetical protein